MNNARSASPRELSIELDHQITNVAYHVRVLAECGALVLLERKPSRGSTEHFYRRAQLPVWALEMIEIDAPGAR